MEQIGLFGGSFDPPHTGHKKLADAAVKACSLDRMFIIPAACSPFKDRVHVGDEDRVAMCRLSFPDEVYTVSDHEIQNGGKSYTVHTVRHFRETYPEAGLWLLIGEDQLLSFAEWFAYREILSMAGLIAAVRTDASRAGVLEAYADANLRAYGSVRILKYEPICLSSTAIRQKRQKGEPIAGDVSPETEQYILEKDLYRGL